MTGKTIRTTVGRIGRFEIREYRVSDGTGGGTVYLYDAGEVDGPGLSPRCDSYEEAVKWAAEQAAAAAILRAAHRNNEPSALRRAFS